MLSREGGSQEQVFSQVLDSVVWEQDSGLQENLPNQGSEASGDWAHLACSQVLRVSFPEAPSPAASSLVLPPPPRLKLLRKLVLVLVAWVDLVFLVHLVFLAHLVFLVASGFLQVRWYQARCNPGLVQQRNPPKYQVLGFLELSRAVSSLAQVSDSLA